MYLCKFCGAVFDEPSEIRYDIEADLGVGGLFPDHHYDEYLGCPECESDDITEIEEDDLEGDEE